MRLLFVAPYYYPELKFGGPPKRIHAISRHLVARGHVVRVVTFHSEHSTAPAAQECDGVRVDYLPWIGRSLRQVPLRTGELKKAIAEADVVHCYGLYNLLCPLAAGLAIRQSKAYLVEPMGMYVPRVARIGWKKLYHALFTNWMIKRAAAVVATSPLEEKELAALGTAARTVVRRNGVELDEFAHLPSKDLMRHRWNVGEDDRVVLYLGRIDGKKNLEELVRAFDKAAIENTFLVIAGPCNESAYLERLRRLIQSIGPLPRVLVDGPLYGEDQLAALAATDLFVMPSLNENFGNAAAEAVAAGVPVLLTDTCGIAPLIHQRAGLAVSLGVEPIADGIRTMLDPTVRDQMTAQREDVKRDLSWDEPIGQTEHLYRDLVATQPLHND